VILAVGSDNRPGQRIGRADVIRAVRVDFVDPGITVLAFPRDLWVALPGLEDRGIRKGRINTAYFYGDLYQLPGQGPSLLAQTLYTNFGLTVDRYAALTMSTFERSIDALGGVDVYLERPVDGSIQGLPFFNAGWHHMQGAQAVQFARIRYPDTDFHRINRQTLVLSALRTRALEPENWARLPGLVRLFLNDTRTDLSRAEIASLICLLPKVAPEDIVSLSVERGMVTSWRTDHGAQVLLPHEEDIRELVATFLSGEVPAGP
jgi:LCP family protein required for cell wall assembly